MCQTTIAKISRTCLNTTSCVRNKKSQESDSESSVLCAFNLVQNGLPDRGMGEKGEGTKKYKFALTKQSLGWKVQNGQYSQ